MSKIIIENQSCLADTVAMDLVHRVVKGGFVSGDNQYCWATLFELGNVIQGDLSVRVLARKSRGSTHSFVVMGNDDEL